MLCSKLREYNFAHFCFFLFVFLYFLKHRSEDIETLYTGADKPTVHSYTIKCFVNNLLLFRIIFVY